MKLISELGKSPENSQRKLSEICGVSLGSIHYCLKALIEKGFIKAHNFKNSQNKLSYVYIVTPSGLVHKKRLTAAFLKRKKIEYENLKKEISCLEKELEHSRIP